MAVLLAAAGRFKMEWLKTTAETLASKESKETSAEPAAIPTPGGWGVAYCYGNRLESLRSNRHWQLDPDFAQLPEIKTDMAMLYLHGPGTRLGPREVQPFVRFEQGQFWAFSHLGTITTQDRLDTGNRLPDSNSLSEKYFLHILEGLSLEDIPGSVAARQKLLSQEPSLSFCLMRSDLMIVSCLFREKSAPGRLWFSRSELLLVMASQPIPSGSPLSSGSLIAITRQRREIP
ncbi:MAG: hypothetical protein ABIK44_05605 [candidate division WOR-3 bacterium]